MQGYHAGDASSAPVPDEQWFPNNHHPAQSLPYHTSGTTNPKASFGPSWTSANPEPTASFAQHQPAEHEDRTRSSGSVHSVYSPLSDTGSGGAPDSPKGDVGDANSTDGGKKRMRKRPTFWTKDEHDKFLAGLQRFGNINGSSLGAGVAELISIYIGTRSVPQVRSHAQKFFLRQKRSSTR
eukprot:1649604-Rhodomonas_salina.4